MKRALGVLAGLLLVFGPGCSAGGDDDAFDGGADAGGLDASGAAGMGGTGGGELQWKTIAGGTFQMGLDDISWENPEEPAHGVTVPSFEMLKTEVTVGQYAACVEEGECPEPSGSRDSTYNWDDDAGSDSGPKAGREKHPVNGVDWNQARDFCAWIGGRLPSEAEWEYAARSGGRDFDYPWGNTKAWCGYAVMDDGNGDGCGTGTTAEVCSKTAGNTDQGLCDMAGNVWELVEDDWHDSYSGAPDDGSSWVDSPRGFYRVRRGGGFYTERWNLSMVHRENVFPSYRDVFLGFRCAR